MYKALIADDEEIIRSGLSRLLAKDPDFEAAVLAEDGEQALELAAGHLPDLLLVDINMPFLNGLEFIERLEGVLRGAALHRGALFRPRALAPGGGGVPAPLSPAPEPPFPARGGGHLRRLPLAGAHPAGGRAARGRGAQDV